MGTAPPTPAVITTPLYVNAPFTVTWSAGRDNTGGEGMLSCVVQQRNGGTWADWQSCMSGGAQQYSLSSGSVSFRSVAKDKALNQATSAVVTTTCDGTPPTITSLNVPTQTAASFVVSWSGQDNVSGIAYYDAQYQIDEGAWTDWLTRTLATQATFDGQSGHIYAFRVRAVDRAGNVSMWSVSGSLMASGPKKYYTAAGRRVAMRVGDVVYYLHGDHLGSTSLVTNGAGEVVAQQLYTPYGSPRWITGTLPTDFTFTGQRADATGLMYFRARYYAAGLARFVSADTIVPGAGDPQSLNRYAYTKNNPIKYTDPTGHMEAVDIGGRKWEPPPRIPLSKLREMDKRDAVAYAATYAGTELGWQPAAGVRVRYGGKAPKPNILAQNVDFSDYPDVDNSLYVYDEAFEYAETTDDLLGSIIHETHHTHTEAQIEEARDNRIWYTHAQIEVPVGLSSMSLDTHCPIPELGLDLHLEGERYRAVREIAAIQATLDAPLNYSMNYRVGQTAVQRRWVLAQSSCSVFFYPTLP